MVYDTFSSVFIVVSVKDIAGRAYELYVNRGYVDSFDRENSLRVERESRTPLIAARVFQRRATQR